MSLKAVVGYVSNGFIRTEFHDCLMTLVLKNGIGGRISATSGPRLASARNEVVKRFLATNREWLWMLDTDMTFGPDTLNELLAVDEPIVGALCFGTESGQPFPVLHRLGEDGMHKVPDYPKDELVEVDATGAACLLVHRDVLEKLRANDDGLYPWFQEGRTLQGQEVGEDVAFCLKARELDFPIYVHTGIKTGHVKTHVLNEEFYEGVRWKESSE